MSVPHFTSEDTEAQGALIICLKLTSVFIPKARRGWWKAWALGCLHGNSFFFFCTEEQCVSSKFLSPISVQFPWLQCGGCNAREKRCH